MEPCLQEGRLQVFSPVHWLMFFDDSAAEDASGTLTYEEFQAHMSNPVVGISVGSFFSLSLSNAFSVEAFGFGFW